MNTHAFSNPSNVFTTDRSWIEMLQSSSVPVEESLSQIVAALTDKAIYSLTSNDFLVFNNSCDPMKPVVVQDCYLCESQDFLCIECIGSAACVVDEYVDDIQHLAFKHLGNFDGLNYYELYMADYCGLYTKFDLVVEA